MMVWDSEFLIDLSQNLDVISWLAPTCNRRNLRTHRLHILAIFSSALNLLCIVFQLKVSYIYVLIGPFIFCACTLQAKPPKVERKCRYCNAYGMHDYRNCPERRRATSSPEEEDGGKRMERTLTNTARLQPVCHIPFAWLHRCMDLLTPRSSQSSVPSF
jgi:hypothetical protein